MALTKPTKPRMGGFCQFWQCCRMCVRRIFLLLLREKIYEYPQRVTDKTDETSALDGAERGGGDPAADPSTQDRAPLLPLSVAAGATFGTWRPAQPTSLRSSPELAQAWPASRRWLTS